ncbi:MAG: hypothetical protein RLP44_19185 [Aggregatilineales bacterium]
MPLTLSNRLFRLSAIVLLLSVFGIGSAFFIGEVGAAVPQMVVVGQGDDGEYSLYLTDSRLNISTTLVTYDAMISRPQWSPDGREMIYRVYHADGHRLYIYNLETGKTRLSWADGTTYNGLPAWSPDGSEIAFVSNNQGGYSFLYVMNLETREFRSLTPSTVNADTPIWSADGTALHYTAWRSNRDVLISVNADGTNARILLPDYFSGLIPVAWSPSREQIAFPQSRTNGMVQRSDLYLMDIFENANPNESERVATDAGVNAYPAWSPDGEQIAFVSNRDGDTDLYRVSATGDAENETAIRLTDLPSNTAPTEPLWSADGGSVAFFSVVSGQRETIYVVGADGHGLHRLSFPRAPLAMAWRP